MTFLGLDGPLQFGLTVGIISMLEREREMGRYIAVRNTGSRRVGFRIRGGRLPGKTPCWASAFAERKLVASSAAASKPGK